MSSGRGGLFRLVNECITATISVAKSSDWLIRRMRLC